MDIFGLGNILNALKFSKKVEPSQKMDKSGDVNAFASLPSSEDSVSISDEAFVKSSIERVSREIKLYQDEVREDKISEIREKLSKGEYQVPLRSVADRIAEGPDR